VNWFRKNSEGKFIWPGFGENARVIDWIVRSLQGKSKASASALGYHPGEGELNIEGLSLRATEMRELFEVDADSWLDEVARVEEFLAGFKERLPEEMRMQTANLRSRLETADA
jgi:phosphoenolpyruvate carboxykinase (GTP)